MQWRDWLQRFERTEATIPDGPIAQPSYVHERVKSDREAGPARITGYPGRGAVLTR